jgi:hypothetical protein
MKTLFNLNALLLFGVALLFADCGGGDDEEIAAPAVTADFWFQQNEDGQVTFENSSLNAIAYKWDFGDNGQSVEKNPTYTYTASGIYTVKLTATGADGKTAEKISKVTIQLFAGPNLVKGAEANAFEDAAWEEINFNSNKATFTYDGSMSFNGAINATAMIFQSIEVEANKEYQLMVDVKGSNLDQALMGVFLLDEPPAVGAEPTLANAFVQWNTICGKSANVAGDLVTIQCRLNPENHVGEDGTITFTEAGTIYLGIKVEVFGNWGSGIAINKVSFRPTK